MSVRKNDSGVPAAGQPISMLEKLGLIGGPTRGGTGHPGSKKGAVHVSPDARVRVVVAPGQKCVPPALKARKQYTVPRPMSTDNRLASYGKLAFGTELTPAQRRRYVKKARAMARGQQVTVTTSPAAAGPESARTWLPKWASQAAFNRGARATLRWTPGATRAITEKDDHDEQD